MTGKEWSPCWAQTLSPWIRREGLSNGLAFSPDEKYLYLTDTSGGKKSIMRFEVQPDDTISNGQLFIEMNADKAPGGPDGMKVDQKGNVYCTGPGGLWIMSPDGTHLGTILTSELPANLSFGGTDGKMLFLSARTGFISDTSEDTRNIPWTE